MVHKVLYIGGTGEISLSCVQASVAAGHDTYVFNRGQRPVELPPEVTVLRGDLNDPASYGSLADQGFDAVCQFLAFTPADVTRDIEVFTGNTGQYVFISSASAYQKPPKTHRITEAVPLVNPFWEYSRLKAGAEAVLTGQSDLPYTIVRPSHTIRTRLATILSERSLAGHRILNGKPVITAGDGTSLWTLTRSEDFAPPFVRLLRNPEAMGQTFHLTGDNAFMWDHIYQALARGLGAEAEIVHIPTDTLIRYLPDLRGPLLGDKIWPVVFDNTAIKQVVGEFASESDLDKILAGPIATFHTSNYAPSSEDLELDATMDRIIADQTALGG